MTACIHGEHTPVLHCAQRVPNLRKWNDSKLGFNFLAVITTGHRQNNVRVALLNRVPANFHARFSCPPQHVTPAAKLDTSRHPLSGGNRSIEPPQAKHAGPTLASISPPMRTLP